MNPFAYFKDVTSKKIYKENKLIGKNVIRILKGTEELPENDFIKDFVFHSTASIDAILNHLFFREIKDKNELKINVFKRELPKLNTEKTFELFKFIIGFYLILFLSNKNNKNFLKEIRLPQEEFQNRIFKIFSCNENDRKNFDELFKVFQQRNNLLDFVINFYEFITKKVFGEKDENPTSSLFFSTMLTSSYESFFNGLFKRN